MCQVDATPTRIETGPVKGTGYHNKHVNDSLGRLIAWAFPSHFETLQKNVVAVSSTF